MENKLTNRKNRFVKKVINVTYFYYMAMMIKIDIYNFTGNYHVD